MHTSCRGTRVTNEHAVTSHVIQTFLLFSNVLCATLHVCALALQVDLAKATHLKAKLQTELQELDDLEDNLRVLQQVGARAFLCHHLLSDDPQTSLITHVAAHTHTHTHTRILASRQGKRTSRRKWMLAQK